MVKRQGKSYETRGSKVRYRMVGLRGLEFGAEKNIGEREKLVEFKKGIHGINLEVSNLTLNL